MRRVFTAFLIAAALGACATPPAPPAPAGPAMWDLPLRIAAGDRWTLVYTNDLRTSVMDQANRQVVRQIYQVDALSTDAWRWTPEPQVQPAAQARAAAVAGAPIECRVSPGGRCLEVRNWAALQGLLLADAQTATLAGAQALAPASQTLALQQMIGRIDAATAAGLLMQHIAILGRIQGLRMPEGASIAFDAATPNPLGGAPMPARGLITLVGVDPAAGVATIRFRQELDAAAAGPALRETLITMAAGAPSGEPVGVAAVEAAAEFVDSTLGIVRVEWLEDGEAAIDLATGAAREVTSTISGRVQTEGGILPFNLTVSGTTRITQTAAAPAPQHVEFSSPTQGDAR